MTSPGTIVQEEENTFKSEVYRFDDVVLDAGRRELTRAGNAVTLQPKAFEFLLYLIRNRSRAIDKDELQDALWPRSIVTETALTRVVMKARRAVGDDADRQSVIRTVHGHGYRFVADLESTEPPGTAASGATTTAPQSPQPRRSPVRGAIATVTLLAALLFASLYFTTDTISGPVRVGVLPIVNDTGDPELDYVETGFMALMNRMLEDRGIDTVSSRDIAGFAGELPQVELLQPDSDFQDKLRRTTAFTNLVGARLEQNDAVYELSYTFTFPDRRPLRRKFVSDQPTELIAQAVATISDIVEGGPPSIGNTRAISGDAFLNEAYARAMALQHAGKFEDAKQLFDIIVEQQPELFWPRYEYALCARFLGEHDEAEAILLDLIEELDDGGASRERASANNALNVLYVIQRRNEEAMSVNDETIRNAREIGDLDVEATAEINRALVARNLGDTETAYQRLLRAVDIYRSMNIESLPGSLLNNLSGVLISRGRLDEAREYSLEAVANFRLRGIRLHESYAMSRLSEIQRLSGDFEEAESTATAALRIREELNDRRGVSISLATLSRIARARGELTRARQLGEQIREIGAELDDEDITMFALQLIGEANLAARKAQEAAANFAAADAIARSFNDRSNEIESRAGLARAWILSGNLRAARDIADELIQAATSSEEQREHAGAANLMGQILMAERAWPEAIRQLERAHGVAESVGDIQLRISTSLDLAACWLETDEPQNATPYLDYVAGVRPDNPDLLRLFARVAAKNEEFKSAAAYMTDARNHAGEAWTADDSATLESYRSADLLEAENAD